MDLPDLQNPDNWMALAAVSALILSQLPPILPLVWGRIRGSRVLLTTGDTFGLKHHLGRAFLVLHVQIENTGPSPVAIAKIDCVIRRVTSGEVRNKSMLWRLPATTYFSETARSFQSEAVPRLFIGTIQLKSGEIWQEVVQCYGSRSLEDEEKAQEIQDRFKHYIGRELDQRRENRNDDMSYVEVSNELVDEARQFATSMFDLAKGEYEFYIASQDRDGRLLGATKHKFILYDNMINSLRSVMDDYKYGFGVSEGDPPYRRAHVEPHLVLIGSDKRVRRQYEAITSETSV